MHEVVVLGHGEWAGVDSDRQLVDYFNAWAEGEKLAGGNENLMTLAGRKGCDKL